MLAFPPLVDLPRFFSLASLPRSPLIGRPRRPDSARGIHGRLASLEQLTADLVVLASPCGFSTASLWAMEP